MSLGYFLVYLLTTLLNLIIGTAVWLKNPRNRLNQTFAIFIFGLIGWTREYSRIAAFGLSLDFGRAEYRNLQPM